MTNELFNEIVDSFAGLDHKHDPARKFKFGDHLLNRMSAHNVRAFGLVLQETIHFVHCSIECANLFFYNSNQNKQLKKKFVIKRYNKAYHKAVIVHIEYQILTHDGQADHSYISTLRKDI